MGLFYLIGYWGVSSGISTSIRYFSSKVINKRWIDDEPRSKIRVGVISCQIRSRAWLFTLFRRHANLGRRSRPTRTAEPIVRGHSVVTGEGGVERVGAAFEFLSPTSDGVSHTVAADDVRDPDCGKDGVNYSPVFTTIDSILPYNPPISSRNRQVESVSLDGVTAAYSRWFDYGPSVFG